MINSNAAQWLDESIMSEGMEVGQKNFLPDLIENQCGRLLNIMGEVSDQRSILMLLTSAIQKFATFARIAEFEQRL